MDKDVLHALKGVFPDALFEDCTLRDFSPRVENTGAVLFGERMVPAEILSFNHQLGPRSLPVLFVQGKGTLVGVEPLFQHHQLRILPEHWTSALLRQIVSSTSQPTAPAQLHFLDGLVEGLRDPLASISGYLQLLRAQESDENYLAPALAATRQLDGILEVIHLISPHRNPHLTHLPLEAILTDACREARQLGLDAAPPSAPVAEIQADGRLIQAALTVSLQYLIKFGTEGKPRLQVQEDSHHLAIFWALAEQEAKIGEVAPPYFHEHLIQSLAEKLGGKAHFKHCGNSIPSQAGVRLPTAKI